MKTEINHPKVSKINWTALVMALVGIAVAFDLIPEDAEEPIVTATLTVGPVLIGTFRTWFTQPYQGVK